MREENAEMPATALRPAWAPIAFLCVTVVYLIGFLARMVAAWACGWLS